MSESGIRFGVIGAGGGGQAMAGYLSAQGFSTYLYNRSKSRISIISRQKGLCLRGEVEKFAPLDMVTSSIAEAVSGVDVIMVVVPAFAHRAIAFKAAPHLRPGQIIVLNPGRTGGALEFRFALDNLGVSQDVIVAEAQTFIFASRVTGPAEATIFGIKRTVPLAALPASRTGMVLQAVRRAFPQFTSAANVLETSMANIGAIFHPAPTLLNAARIEQGAAFEYYREGITPSVTRILARMDTERCNVSRALNVEPLSAVEFLNRAYGVKADRLDSALRSNSGYQGISAPPTLKHRYITEDVPASLVPIASFGRMLGVATPTIDSIIHLASVLRGTDYWAQGRTVRRLGLEDLSLGQMWNLVDNGRVGQKVG